MGRRRCRQANNVFVCICGARLAHERIVQISRRSLRQRARLSLSLAPLLRAQPNQSPLFPTRRANKQTRAQSSSQMSTTMIIEEFEPDVFRQLIEYIHTGCVLLQARTLLGKSRVYSLSLSLSLAD